LSGTTQGLVLTRLGGVPAIFNPGSPPTLADLIADANNYFQIDTVKFTDFRYIADFPWIPINPELILVFPLGEGSNEPGLSFVAIGDEWSTHALDIDGYFQRSRDLQFTVKAVDPAQPISLVSTKFNIEDRLVNRGSTDDFTFEGGTLHGGIYVKNDPEDVFPATLDYRLYEDPNNVSLTGLCFPGSCPLENTVNAFGLGEVTIQNQFQLTGSDLGEAEPYLWEAEIDQINYTVLLGGLPPAPTEEPSNMIQNGFFLDGLNEWSGDGSGTADVVPTTGGPAVEITTAGKNPMGLTQLIDTPTQTFMVNFDYQFFTFAGLLEMLINDTVVYSKFSDNSPAYQHEEVLINDPTLMGITDAELKFRLTPTNQYINSRIQIGNLLSPVFNLISRGVKADVDIDENEGGLYTRPPVVKPDANTEIAFSVIASDEYDFIYSVHDDYNWVDVHTFLKGDAKASASFLTRGIEWGSQGMVEDLRPLDPNPSVVNGWYGLVDTNSQATLIYQVVAAGPLTTSVVDLDYVLRIHGTFEISGRTTDPNGQFSTGRPLHKVDLRNRTRTSHGLQRAKRPITYYGYVYTSNLVPFSFNEEDFGNQLAETAVCNCPNDILDQIDISQIPEPRDGPATKVIDEEYDGEGNLLSRTIVIDQLYCFEDMLWAAPGDKVFVKGQTLQTVEKGPRFHGRASGDFFNTVEIQLFTSTPGVVIELVDPCSSDNEPPTADANGPYAGIAGSLILFDGSGSTDSDGNIAAYDWDFGDGNTASGVNPSHTYLAAGTYTVSLTVTDDDGDVNSETTTAVIDPVPNQPPDANAGPDQTVGIDANCLGNVVLDGSGSTDADDNSLTYSWSIGGEVIATGINPTVELGLGVHTVQLRVNDGAEDSQPDQVVITVEDPIADVTYDGDSLLSTEGAATVDAILTAILRDYAGNLLDIDGKEVTFTLTAEGVGTLVAKADSIDGIANVVLPLEPAVYKIDITLECSGCIAQAILVIYNPEGGFATGGGWILPLDDGLNTYSNQRANFGFNAKYKKGDPTGHIEFRYSDGYVDLKSSSVDQLVITGGKIVQFKGLASVNGVKNYSYFVKGIDESEPGINNDVFDIKIWAPGASIEGDPNERAGGTLSGGNIIVNTK
jgi:PKD repeat protein